MKVFGLFEYYSKNDIHNITAKLAAQIVWYFIEGFANRQNTHEAENENNTMFRVEVQDLDNPLVF